MSMHLENMSNGQEIPQNAQSMMSTLGTRKREKDR